MVQAGHLFNLTANGKYLELGRFMIQILHKSDTMGQHKHYYSPTYIFQRIKSSMSLVSFSLNGQ
jgi:hypothetical protein